jgi:hypothetical protein
MGVLTGSGERIGAMGRIVKVLGAEKLCENGLLTGPAGT